jgi:hypothetical protein
LLNKGEVELHLDVASGHWPRRAASMTSKKKTRRAASVAPVCLCTRVTVDGELTRQESAGRLGERVPIQRVPAIR